MQEEQQHRQREHAGFQQQQQGKSPLMA